MQQILSTIQIKLNQILKHRPSVRILIIISVGMIGVVVLANLAMAWYYQDHYYPKTFIGDVKVAGMSESRAHQVLVDRVDRQPLVMDFDDEIVKIPTKELGATYNISQTITNLNRQPKPVIPLLALLPGDSSTSTTLEYQLDQAAFDKKLAQLLQEHSTKPQDATLEIREGSAKISDHKPGIQFDRSSVATAVKFGLGQLSDKPITIPVKTVAVEVATMDLRPALEQANRRLGTHITLSYEDKHFTPSRTEIGSWLKLNDQLAVTVLEPAVAKYIEQIASDIDVATKNEVITTLDGVESGRQPGQPGRSLNRNDVTQAILQAMSKAQNLDYQLKVETVEPSIEYVRKFTFSALTYYYCVQTNSVSDAMLQHFSQKIASTLADARGWGLNGQIKFVHVQNGCNFTLVLAAASTLPSYSSVCTVYYSCRVGSNVIINADRWNGASDSWNQAGGSLDNYQSMVINHEVGHWLGFYDNQWVCQGPGQPAPLMQQQSINLRGCAFNPWPTPVELQALRALKGL